MSKLKKTYDVFQYILTISGYVVISIVILYLVYICIEAMGVPFKEWGVASILGAIAKYLFFSACALWFLSALIGYFIGKRLGIDEEKQQRKDEMKEVLQEIEAEKKTRTKTVFNGKNPLVDLSPEQTAVVHKFLCEIPDQGDHIKTSELKHILHALEDRGDIDLSHREQVIAWVEDITQRSVDTSKFWNEYDWRRSKDQEKKWGKKIIEAFDKLR